MVDHLEARGYVARVADPSDGRAKLVELTERGRAAASTTRAVANGIDDAWTARLGPDHLADLKRTLIELLDSLEPKPSSPVRNAGPGGPTATG